VEVIVHDETYRDLEDEVLRNAYGRKYEGRTLPAKEEHITRLLEAAEACHGTEFADSCRAMVEERGHINYAQLVYGLHYSADEMPRGNPKFLKWIRDAGFGWFEEYRGGGEGTAIGRGGVLGVE
jgi:hypothetical protein